MRQATTKLPPKIFLDSSALISAVITSSKSSASACLILLGEAGVVDLSMSREVTNDVERFVRSRNASMLPKVAEVIARGNIATTSEPSKQTIDFCEKCTGYRPDARILAAAVECDADVLVTFDGMHLLDNPRISPTDFSVLIMRPGECLTWCFERWRS